jgi:hypothetical protein
MDRELLEQVVPYKCSKCAGTFHQKWILKGKGPSPSLELKCDSCHKVCRIDTSNTWSGSAFLCFNYMLLLVCILLTGSTWERTSSLFALLEISCGSKSFYSEDAVNLVDSAVTGLTQDFIAECRKKVVNRNDIYLMIDAGWSHPGWWARECTVIGLDCVTGLPIAVFHVIRNKNYQGSSKGMFTFTQPNSSSGMEGFAVLEMMKELKTAGFTVTTILHDKDSSTMRNVMDIFEDVEEALCLSKFVHF